MDSTSLLTPQARAGPSSRLLKRKSLLAGSPQPRMTTQLFSTPSPRRSTAAAAAGGVTPTSFLDATSALDIPMTEVTRPVYAYKPVHEAADRYKGSLQATENLHVDFMSSSSALVASDVGEAEHVLDEVAEYEELVQEHVQRLQRALDQPNPSTDETNFTTQVRLQLSKERNTWRLIGKLFTLRNLREKRLKEPAEDEEEERLELLSEKNVINRLFEKDEELRRAQAIIDWLEMNVRDDLSPDFLATVASYGESVAGWENTQHYLLTNSNPSKRVITELDPDAPARQQRQLHEEDARNEKRLVELVYMCLRAGMLDRAKEACVEAGQPWRAATLVGWELAHDPNRGAPDGTETKEPAQGNFNRDLWKLMAWRMSESETLQTYDRAIYSALCGNARQLLNTRICSSWEDVLWARCRSMVDTMVEGHIRETLAKKFIEMPQAYWDNLTNLGDIFDSVKRSSPANDCPYKTIQTMVILEDWPGLRTCLTNCMPMADPHLLRFMCHLILCLEKLLDRSPATDKGEDIDLADLKQALLRRYIQFLSLERRVGQVAWYSAHLRTAEAQVEAFVEFLGTLVLPEERKAGLRMGYENELPMEEIRKTLVRQILECDSRDDDDAMDEERSVTDEEKIKSLDWLLYDPPERVDAILECNALARFFIAEHKPDLAGLALQKSSSLFPDAVIDSEHVREFECLTAFVIAKEKFGEWFKFYHQCKPNMPEVPKQSKGKEAYLERVSMEAKKAKYKEEMKRWESSLRTQSSDVAASLETVLRFPSGWLDIEGLGESARARELNYLRRTCLVDCVFLLHSVYDKTGQHGKASKVADLVASEVHGLYSLFSKEDMAKFLATVRSSFVALLEETGEAFEGKK